VQYDIRVNIADAIRELNLLHREIIPAATARALDRTAQNARTVAIKTIREETGLPAKLIRDRLRIRGANRNRLEAIITALKAAPNLSNFQARQTKRGVSAKAWNKRKVYPRTFIANNGRTVFKRVGKARLPIEPVYGPSVPRTFMQRRAQQAMEATIESRFRFNFDAAVQGLLIRRGLR